MPIARTTRETVCLTWDEAFPRETVAAPPEMPMIIATLLTVAKHWVRPRALTARGQGTGHKWLDQQNSFTPSWGRGVPDQGECGAAPRPKALRVSVEHSPSALGCLLQSLVCLASGSITPISTFIFTWHPSSPVCVCLQISPFDKHQPYRIRVQPSDLILTQSPPERPYFQQVTFQGTWCSDVDI